MVIYMKHEIDLKNYQIRTDLMVETIEEKETIKGIVSKIETIDNIKITKVNVNKVGSNIINRKPGDYITIEFEDVTDSNNLKTVKEVFVNELKELFETININDDSKCLVIGLGNKNSTPDALGPLSIDNILVTNHLFIIGDVEKGFRPVSAITPGVTGVTGIETSDLIKSIVDGTKPDFLIVIDALASQSLSRVNKTIQMSNTGIHPGSGIGNSRKEISKETLNIPVISIGVPTVVDAVTVVSDTIHYMHKHYAFNKKFLQSPISKLSNPLQINYLKKDIKIEENDKTNLLGLIGSLTETEIKQLIFEVLTPIGYNLMVTPKEVDFIMEKLSNIIGNGINEALHKKISN